MHFGLIYFLNFKASREPSLHLFIYFKVFFLLLLKNLAEKCKYNQNVTDKFRSGVLCIYRERDFDVIFAELSQLTAMV